MTKKTLRQLAENFGKEWQCSCKASFGASNLEVISESESSLVAHYTCPSCGREQMLAASITDERELNNNDFASSLGVVSADDVLDIRAEVQAMKLPALRTLQRSRVKKQKLNQPTS